MSHMAIYEHDRIVLLKSFQHLGLHTGDIGTVVHCWIGAAYEVEFITSAGTTYIVSTILHEDLRPLISTDSLSRRQLERISPEVTTLDHMPCIADCPAQIQDRENNHAYDDL